MAVIGLIYPRAKTDRTPARSPLHAYYEFLWRQSRQGLGHASAAAPIVRNRQTVRALRYGSRGMMAADERGTAHTMSGDRRLA